MATSWKSRDGRIGHNKALTVVKRWAKEFCCWVVGVNGCRKEGMQCLLYAEN